MYNKEALRKLLEDCWDAGVKRAYVDDFGPVPNKNPDRDTYITSLLSESPSDGQDWISVEKELPPIGKQVLIYEPDPNGKGKHEQETIAVSHYAGKKPRNEKYWYEWPDGQDEQPGSYYPTHWQPLPEPPKIN